MVHSQLSTLNFQLLWKKVGRVAGVVFFGWAVANWCRGWHFAGGNDYGYEFGGLSICEDGRAEGTQGGVAWSV
jgi:hypothetical protein